jgi:hypothetical protein
MRRRIPVWLTILIAVAILTAGCEERECANAQRWFASHRQYIGNPISIQKHNYEVVNAGRVLDRMGLLQEVQTMRLISATETHYEGNGMFFFGWGTVHAEGGTRDVVKFLWKPRADICCVGKFPLDRIELHPSADGGTRMYWVFDLDALNRRLLANKLLNRAPAEILADALKMVIYTSDDNIVKIANGIGL